MKYDKHKIWLFAFLLHHPLEIDNNGSLVPYLIEEEEENKNHGRRVVLREDSNDQETMMTNTGFLHAIQYQYHTG